MDRFKVVIIDDNEVIINSLLATINWEEFSCEVAGVAYDGKAGTELIKDTVPDIVISDIRLPFCDGIDMIESTMDVLSDCKTILISGYSDFEYAKRGIKINVFDYLLKPLDTKDLNKTLKKATEQLMEDRNNATTIKSLKENNKYIKELSDNNKLMAKRLELMSILSLSQSSAHNDIVKFFENEKENFEGFIIMISAISECSTPLEQVFTDFTKRVTPTIDNEEIITLRMGSNIITLVIFLNRLPNIVKQYGIKIYDRLRIACHDQTANILSVSSELYTDPEMLYNAYIKSTLILQKETLQKGANKTYYAGEYSDMNDINYISLINCSEEFSNNLDYSNPDEIYLHLDKYILQCINDGNNNPALIKLMLLDIVFSYIKKNNIQYVFLNDDKINKAINTFRESQFLISDTSVILNLLTELIKIKDENEGYSPLVKSAMKYIHECPLDDLTLSHVADHFNITPAYLCRVIKKEKNCSFLTIVREIKMNKAKKLLDDLSYSIEDVAYEIGYSSYLGFLKAFKNSEGITPQQYRSGL